MAAAAEYTKRMELFDAVDEAALDELVTAYYQINSMLRKRPQAQGAA